MMESGEKDICISPPSFLTVRQLQFFAVFTSSSRNFHNLVCISTQFLRKVIQDVQQKQCVVRDKGGMKRD